MKKFFTLFIATVVAMSMMAMPQNLNAGKKSKPASIEQFEAKTPTQAKSLEMYKASMVERDFVRPEATKKEAPAKLATSKKMAKAPAEVIDLHFDGFSVTPEWYEETGDWYMACSNVDGYIVKFDILSPTYVGTFTLEDFDLGYSYMYTPDSYSAVDYVDITCTIEEKQVGQYLKQILLTATIEGSDGNTYNVTCVHSELTPKAVEEHVIANATLEFDGEQFVLAGKNETMDVNLTVVAYWPSGPFTKGEFVMDATSITYNGVAQEILSADLLVSTAAVDGVPAYIAELAYYNQDTILHQVSMVAPLPTPTDTVEISMNNLAVDDSWAFFTGWVYLTAVNAEWDIYGGVFATEAAEGTWTGEDVMLYITNQQTYEATEAVYAEATVVEDLEQGWLVEFKAHCIDGKYYVVNMKFEIPEPTDTVTLRFDNSAQCAFYPTLGNDLQLANQDENYFVAIDIYNTPMGGEFTLDNMDSYYSQLVDMTTMSQIELADVKGTINQYGDTTVMAAEIIGFDAVLYDVVLWYVVPTPSEVVELTVEAEFDNQLEGSGYYTLSGQANGSDLLVAMSPMTDEVEGTFVNDGLFGKFGAEGGQYDFFASYTYVAAPAGVDEFGDPKYDVYSVEKGTMEVTMDEEGNIVAKASVICSNAVQYEITMTSKFDIPHLEYDAEYPVEQFYTANDLMAVEYDAEYGAIYFDVASADLTTLLSLVFFAEEADADIVIPVGTYPIEKSQDYGTVLASDGYDGYYVYPSLYGETNEEGALLVPLWFLVGGSVEVSKTTDGQLHVEVNALNSYNQTVHVVYDGTATGLENVEVENITGVKKMMLDGQLVIVRDGKAFNAMGAQVK